jgi:hypothetical protein
MFSIDSLLKAKEKNLQKRKVYIANSKKHGILEKSTKEQSKLLWGKNVEVQRQNLKFNVQELIVHIGRTKQTGIIWSTATNGNEPSCTSRTNSGKFKTYANQFAQIHVFDKSSRHVNI